MDTRAKVCLIIGGILLLVGIGGFALGVSQIDNIEDAQPDFILEEVTNGTLMVADEDGQGDAGFVFFDVGFVFLFSESKFERERDGFFDFLSFDQV